MEETPSTEPAIVAKPVQPDCDHDVVQCNYPQQLVDEARAMAQFAFAKGMAVPPEVAATVAKAIEHPRRFSTELVKELARSHRKLSGIVAPAFPSTILLLDRDTAREAGTHFLGPVPLIRRLLVVAMLSLLALILTSLSPNVDGTPEHFNLLQSHGTVLLLNELFVLSAASLGASFANLFMAHRYVRNATFDPNLESSYWIRFASGVIAGTILAMLLPMWLLNAQTAAPTSGHSALAGGLGAPALAMIGGFSADLVYRILHRITESIESLVRGDMSDQVAAREQEGRSRLKEQQVRDRFALLSNVSELQQKLADTSDISEIKSELQRFQQKLLDDGDG